MTPSRIWTIADPVSAAQSDNAGLLVAYLGIEFVAAGAGLALIPDLTIAHVP